jgi:hypothetical protein
MAFQGPSYGLSRECQLKVSLNLISKVGVFANCAFSYALACFSFLIIISFYEPHK